MNNAVLLAGTCEYGFFSNIGTTLSIATPLGVTVFLAIAVTRKRVFNAVTGFLTPKKKIWLAYILNGVGGIGVAVLFITILTYVAFPATLPDGMAPCLQPY